MSLVFHWFLPTSGDGRGIVGRGHSIPLIGATARPSEYATGARSAARPPDIDYLGQIARSAEQLGFTGVLTPTGTWCEDAWLTTAALISQTKRLKFLVAFRPGFVVPTLAAQMAATYQRLSGGRLLLNVVTGGEATSSATTSGTRGPGNSSTSSAAPGAGRRTTSPATTTQSRAPR